MTGRDRCDKLKEIRKSLADNLNINLNQEECKFEGECIGTCPRCKQEERILNNALLKKGVALAGAAIMTVSLGACTFQTAGETEPIENEPPTVIEEPQNTDNPQNNDGGDVEALSGDIEYVEPVE